MVFCEELSGFCPPSALVEGSGVDVLHHVAVDGIDEALGGLLPVGDVLLMAPQHHVAAHVEQGVLRAELCLGLAQGIVADGLQVLLLLGDLLFRGIVPLILLLLLDGHAVEILLQVLQVAHHQGVAFLASSLDHVVGTEPEVLLVGAEVGLPVVVAHLVDALLELQVVVGAEQVVVVVV